MLAALVTFEFDAAPEGAPADELAEVTISHGEGVAGLRSTIDWRDPPNKRGGTIYIWDSREHAANYYDETFMEDCERRVGVRPVVRFVEVTGVLDHALPAGPARNPTTS